MSSCTAGSKLLAESLAQCEDDDNIRQALLHVHTANEEALDWYQHRGFKVHATAVCTCPHCRTVMLHHTLSAAALAERTV